MGGPDLKALSCPSCGAAVPLGTAASARCLRCGTDVPVLPEYIELRTLRTRDAAQRQAADTLLRKLDRPPWLATKILARIFDQPALVFWMVYGVPVGLFGIIGAMGIENRVLAMLHRPPANALTEAILLYIGAGAIIFVLVFIPRLFGIYANRHATGRSQLLDSLRARPPEQAGGAAQCRVCGAPLDVTTGALVARCLYCETDNVLVIRTPVLTRTRRTVAQVGRAMTDAVAFDRAEHRVLFATIARELRRYLVRAFFLVVPFLVFAWDSERVKGTETAPGWGILALVFLVFYLIWMFTLGSERKRSGPPVIQGHKAKARAAKAGVAFTDDSAEEANDVPQWVAFAGPVGFWILILTVPRVLQWLH